MLWINKPIVGIAYGIRNVRDKQQRGIKDCFILG